MFICCSGSQIKAVALVHDTEKTRMIAQIATYPLYHLPLLPNSRKEETEVLITLGSYLITTRPNTCHEVHLEVEPISQLFWERCGFTVVPDSQAKQKGKVLLYRPLPLRLKKEA